VGYTASQGNWYVWPVMLTEVKQMTYELQGYAVKNLANAGCISIWKCFL